MDCENAISFHRSSRFENQCVAIMVENSAWTFADGWILMSVFLVHRENGASLDEIIGAADAMNHLIPTLDELSLALTRLASCGVLAEVDNRIRIATAHLPSIAKASQGRGGAFSIPDRGRKWLKRMRFCVGDEIRVSISDVQLALAYDIYIKRLRHR